MVLCEVVLCQVVLCEVVLCEVVLCEVVLCEVVLCEVVLCEVVLCEVVLCDVVLCEVVLFAMTRLKSPTLLFFSSLRYPAGKDLLPTEVQYVDDFPLLAAHVLMDNDNEPGGKLWSENLPLATLILETFWVGDL